MDAERFAWLDLVYVPLLAIAGEDDQVVRANTQAAALMGSDPTGTPLAALIGAYAAGRVRGLLAEAGLDTPEMVLYCHTPVGLATLGFKAARLPDGDGAILTLRAHGTRGAPSGGVGDFGTMLEDIVRSLPVGVEIYDGNFRELFCNSLSDQLFGYDYHGAAPHHDDWWEHGFPDDAVRARVIAEWRERLEIARTDAQAVQKVEWDVMCRDGVKRSVQFRFRFIGDTYIVVFWDVSERRRLEEELRHLAGTDELTGLCNRRRFFQEADRAFLLAMTTASDLSVLMLDIDHFKHINDQHGHAAGDSVLREVAQRCRHVLRARDVLARIGGEEFAVLLPSTDAAGAERVANNLRLVIGANAIATADATLAVRASVGGTCLMRGDLGIEMMVDRADRALYAAKGGGRNRVVILPLFTEDGAPPPAVQREIGA